MAKAFILGAILTVAAASGVVAQTSQGGPAAAAPNPGVRGNYITSTGETVPIPGASQSAGTTPMDRGIQREDDRITSGICRGC